MRRFLGISATFVIVAVFVLLIIGCGGGGDTTGPGSGTMSLDDQFESFDEFVNMDFDSDESMFDMTEIVSSQASSPYWDGVDSSDIFGDPVFSAPPLQGLGKLGKLQTEELALTYNGSSGWWSIRYDAVDDFFGIVIHVRDSVRFETVDGSSQRDPDESTYRVVERGWMTMDWELSGDEGSFDLAMTTDVQLEVVGLNASVVTVEGGSSGEFVFDVESADTSVYLAFDFTAENDNVTVDGPNPGALACPTGGSASASFSLEIDVHEGNNHQSASGDWACSVQFLGDGQASLTVESGDFSNTATGDICE